MARNDYDAYTEGYYVQYGNTISSGETRIPVCFCIDISSSMISLTNKEDDYEEDPNSFMKDGAPSRYARMKPGRKAHTRIDELKRVLKQMIGRMRMNPILKNSAVVCIVTFSRFADCRVEFSELGNIKEEGRVSVIDPIRAEEDYTNVAKGIRMSLERIDSVSRIISDAGNESYTPVFVFMSDGVPTDGAAANAGQKEVRRRAEQGELIAIPIAIGGDAANEGWLKGFSPDRNVYRMTHEDEFDKVFGAITSRINKTAEVISVDEALVSYKDSVVDNSAGDNAAGTEESAAGTIASSEYGTTASADEMKKLKAKFLSQSSNI